VTDLDHTSRALSDLLNDLAREGRLSSVDKRGMLTHFTCIAEFVSEDGTTSFALLSEEGDTVRDIGHHAHLLDAVARAEYQHLLGLDHHPG
jgi:hypothetical protein